MDRSEDNWNTCLLYRNKQLNKLKYKSRLIPPYMSWYLSSLFACTRSFFLIPKKSSTTEGLFPYIRSPHHLIAERIEEYMVETLHHFDTIIRP